MYDINFFFFFFIYIRKNVSFVRLILKNRQASFLSMFYLRRYSFIRKYNKFELVFFQINVCKTKKKKKRKQIIIFQFFNNMNTCNVFVFPRSINRSQLKRKKKQLNDTSHISFNERQIDLGTNKYRSRDLDPLINHSRLTLFKVDGHSSSARKRRISFEKFEEKKINSADSLVR